MPSTSRPPSDRIIEATLLLLVEHGLAGITMRGIAENAGVSHQTLYNHYSDVESILVAAIGRHFRESIELMQSALATVDEPAAKLEQLVRHTAAIGSHAPEALGIEGGLSADSRVGFREYDDAMQSIIREVLNDGRQSGAFRSDLDLDVDALLIRRILEGVAESSAKKGADVASIVGASIRTVLAAVNSQ